MAKSSNDALVTVIEAARRLRVHPVTVRRLIANGSLVAFKVGRVWRLRLTSIEALEKPEMAK